MLGHDRHTYIACLFLATVILFSGLAAANVPAIILPKTQFTADELAVIVNDDDPLSREIAAYYQARRAIPAKNMLHVRFKPGATTMDEDTFARMFAAVTARTPAQVQAYALTWALPYRVGCMSSTMAFASGYDKRYCRLGKGCAPTRLSPYFDSGSFAPYADFKFRPTMAIAAENFADAKRLIDRGVAADGTYPKGTGYLLSTDDAARNVRQPGFAPIIDRLRGLVDLRLIKANYLRNKTDVLFYFTGSVHVRYLDTLRFVPGAIADHLTSAGGVLDGSDQMSSLRWLQAGATGSYGAVYEPCNYAQKFPAPAVVIDRYYHGESLIEAYWKSVAWPAEGIFIGEPLAAPFGGYKLTAKGNTVTVRGPALRAGDYLLLAANAEGGPYRPERRLTLSEEQAGELTLTELEHRFYQLIKLIR